MKSDTGHSANYDYVIECALKLADTSTPTVLDYGCGRGQLVAAARERGLEFFGADTFTGHYADWADGLEDGAKNAILQIENGRVDAADDSFDIVVSNQVFEHIPHPPPVLKEIARVLKPGGKFLALFPTADVWFEGHIGLYFVHWMKTRSSLQRRYLATARKWGFGYYTQRLDGSGWVDYAMTKLEDVIFYHRYSDVHLWWHDAFGTHPTCHAPDYMRFRIGVSSLKGLSPFAAPPIMAPLLRFICHKRAGRVILVTKVNPSTESHPRP